MRANAAERGSSSQRAVRLVYDPTASLSAATRSMNTRQLPANAAELLVAADTAARLAPRAPMKNSGRNSLPEFFPSARGAAELEPRWVAWT